MLEDIKRRLAAYAPREVEPDGRPRAAVLIPLYIHDGDLHVVFTKRGAEVSSHKGEISFPGGAMDAADVDLVATALRECDEEIGLLREHVEVIGRVDDLVTVSRFHVTAYVGVIDAAALPYVWRPQAAEVAEVIEVPARHLLDGANLVMLPRLREGEIVHQEGFRYGEHVIWGATGRMLRNFIDVALSPITAADGSRRSG